MSILSKPHFHDETVAYEKLESILWVDGPVCPHCGGMEKAYKIKANPERRVRHGLWKCGHCRKQFRVTIGTVFEASNVPLHKWLQAVFLIASSKKGISANQLHRTLEVTLKTAWFMGHRIREAMRSGELVPMGSDGGAVEVDETFIGHDQTKKPRGQKKGRGYHHKYKVFTLVERNTGQARSFHVEEVNSGTLAPMVRENLSREAHMMTDEASYYTKVGREFASHGVVRHNSGEYGRGETHTNTIEGFFSIFKRGMKGVYQHCAKKHLHRYLAEFDFRYSHRVALGISDTDRVDRVLAGIIGKRLLYADSSEA